MTPAVTFDAAERIESTTRPFDSGAFAAELAAKRAGAFARAMKAQGARAEAGRAVLAKCPALARTLKAVGS